MADAEAELEASQCQTYSTTTGSTTPAEPHSTTEDGNQSHSVVKTANGDDIITSSSTMRHSNVPDVVSEIETLTATENGQVDSTSTKPVAASAIATSTMSHETDEATVLLVRPVAAALRCPRCASLLREPTLAVACGHTFCRVCCSPGVAGADPRCPEHPNVQLTAAACVANLALAEHLDSLLAFCPHAYRLPLDTEDSHAIAASATHCDDASGDETADDADANDWGNPAEPATTPTTPQLARQVVTRAEAYASRNSTIVNTPSEEHLESLSSSLSGSLRLGPLSSSPSGSHRSLLAYNRRGQPAARIAMDGRGCTARVPLGQLAAHAAQCAFQPVACPHGPERCAAQVPRPLLPQHLSECAGTPCRNAALGCTFAGRPDDVAAHVPRCSLGGSPLVRQGHLLRAMVEQVAEVRGVLTGMETRLAAVERRGGAGGSASASPSPGTGVVAHAGNSSSSNNSGRGGSLRSEAPWSASGRRMPNSQATTHLPPTPLAAVADVTAGGSSRSPRSSGMSVHPGASVTPSARSSIPATQSQATVATAAGGASASPVKPVSAAVSSASPQRAAQQLSPSGLPSFTPQPHAASHPTAFVPAAPRAAAPPHTPADTAEDEALHWPFNFQCVGTLGGHEGPVWCMAAHGTRLFTSGSEANVAVWDVGGREPQRQGVLQGHDTTVHALHVRPPLLYSGDASRIVKAWRLDTLACVATFTACDDIVSGLVTVGDFLLAASFASVAVHEITSGRKVSTLREGMTHWVRALSADPAGRGAVAASHNVLLAWRAPEFAESCRVTTQHGSIHSLAATRDSVVVGTYNRNIHIYAADTLQYLSELRGHLGTVHALAVSRSGRYLFSASIDTTVKVWNMENKLIIQSLQRHNGSVNSIYWHDNVLFSGSADKTVKVYRPQEGQVVDFSAQRETSAFDPSLQACWGGGKLPPVLPGNGEGDDETLRPWSPSEAASSPDRTRTTTPPLVLSAAGTPSTAPAASAATTGLPAGPGPVPWGVSSASATRPPPPRSNGVGPSVSANGSGSEVTPLGTSRNSTGDRNHPTPTATPGMRTPGGWRPPVGGAVTPLSGRMTPRQRAAASAARLGSFAAGAATSKPTEDLSAGSTPAPATTLVASAGGDDVGIGGQGLPTRSSSSQMLSEV